MTDGLQIARAVADLRDRVRAWRGAGQTVALIPTMGALHDGHLALVRAAQAACDRTVATLFVNPTQFGEGEDFDSYPRSEAADAAKLDAVGADLLFAPPVAEMYPEGFATKVTVAGVSAGLCGAGRPGHFDGVATVVTKLLLQALPDIAFFGEKDFQQICVIRRFVRDLDIPVEIRGVPTVREADGLALSSRNAYLNADERAVAPALYRTLAETAGALAEGAPAAETLDRAKADLAEAGFDSVEYMEFRAADDLAPLDRADRPGRLLAAARLGRTRLIDNVPVPVSA